MASSDAELLDLAWSEAALASSEGEVPVGAVLLTASGRLLRNHNRTCRLGVPWAHAEHLVIASACTETGDWRLEGSVLVSTLEPCLMCAGLAILARVGRIAYGAGDIRFGALGSVTDIRAMKGLNHYPEIAGPLDPERCGGLIRDFFRDVRREGCRL